MLILCLSSLVINKMMKKPLASTGIRAQFNCSSLALLFSDYGEFTPRLGSARVHRCRHFAGTLTSNVVCQVGRIYFVFFIKIAIQDGKQRITSFIH